MNNIRAFIDCEMDKTQAEALAQWHYDGDRFLAGAYDNDEDHGTPEFKGCSVGCMGGTGLHEAYPEKFGIVEGIAHLSDFTFEKLEGETQKIFTVDLFKAIKKGSNTELILKKIMLWILNDKELGVYKINKSREIKAVIDLYKREIKGDKVSKKEWIDAASASSSSANAANASSAAASAASAASSSAYAASSASSASSDNAYAAHAANAAYAAAAASVKDYTLALRKAMLDLFENEVIEEKYIN